MYLVFIPKLALFFIYHAFLSVQSKIGLMLHGVMQCDLALKFLENALALTSKYQGPTSLKVAHG